MKKNSGEVFGPVELSILQEWAAGGRIGHDDQISSDQKTWRPAVEIPELGLDWLVELQGGAFFGPFHLLALGDLIREGSVPANAPIVHRVTGERHVLHEALLLMVMEQNTRLAASVQTLHTELESAYEEQGRVEEELDEAQDERARLAEEHTRLTRALSTAEQEQHRLQDEIKAAEAKHNQLHKEFAGAKGEQARLVDDCSRLTEELSTIKSEHSHLQDELKTAQADNIRIQKELAEVRGERTKLFEDHARLTQTLSVTEKEQHRLQDELKRREILQAEASDKANHLQQTIVALQKENGELKAVLDDCTRLQKELESAAGERARLREEHTRLTQALGAAEQERSRWQDEVKQRETTHSDLLKKTSQLQQLISSLQKENEDLKTTQAEVSRQASVVDSPAFIPDLTASEWKEMASKRDHFEKETHKWKRMYDDLQTASQRREERLAERVEQMRQEDLALRTQLEELKRSSRKLEQTLKQINEVTVFHTDAEAAAAQRAAMLDAYNELSRRCETLMDQLDAKTLELNDVMQSHARSQEEAEHRLQTMESHIQKEREEADRARKRALQLEEDHIQLLRSFRDLNDRYIRLRQVAGHVPSADNPWPPPKDIAKPAQPPKP